MNKRLSAQDWIDFALVNLTREGFDALKAEVLARKLGVSRGSFYWHFQDLSAFHSCVIEHWRQVATEAIIIDIERHGDRTERLQSLLRRAFGEGATVEIRMRAWAENNAEAAKALREVDKRRQDYIKQLLAELGVAEDVAVIRAQVLYWAYLGAACSGSKLKGKRLTRMVDELMHIGIGEPRKPPRREAR